MGTQHIIGPVDPGPGDLVTAMSPLVYPVAWLPDRIGPDHTGVEL